MWGGVLTGSCCSKSNILWYIVEKPLYEFGIIYWRPKTEGSWKIACRGNPSFRDKLFFEYKTCGFIFEKLISMNHLNTKAQSNITQSFSLKWTLSNRRN